MAFPSAPTLTSFVAANGTTPPPGLTNSTFVDEGVQVQSNRCVNVGLSYATAWWNAGVFAADQEARVVVDAVDQENGQIGVLLRVQSPGTAGVDAYLATFDTVLPFPASNVIKVFRCNDNSFTQLATVAGGNLLSGYGFGAEIIDQTINVYVSTGGSYSQVLTYTDNDAAKITGTGFIGLAERSGNLNPVQMTLSSFGGGAYSAGVQVPGPSPLMGRRWP